MMGLLFFVAHVKGNKMNKRIRALRELAVVMSTLPAGSMIEPRYMQACEPNFIINLIDSLQEETANAANMVREIADLKALLGSRK